MSWLSKIISIGPLVLTVHLKRFDNAMMRINKINRHINYSETLSLRPYVSDQTSDPLNYELQGIVIHMGYSCGSGHYYSYVKNSNGMWHLVKIFLWYNNVYR